MKLRIQFTLVALSLSSFYTCDASFNNLTLDFVQVLFRHGARTASKSEARFMNVTNPSVYGLQNGYEQLTSVGKKQVYALGTSLRKRYNNFLGAYSPEKYYAIASRYSRAIMSLQLTLAGLFPPLPENVWNKKLPWNPIPHHQLLPGRNLALQPVLTAKFMDLFNRTFADSIEIQEKLNKYDEFFWYMTNKTSIPFKKDVQYNSAHANNALQTLESMKLPFPDWCNNSIIFENIRDLYHLALEAMCWTPKLRRVFGGTLVRRLIENINDNRNAAVPKKMYLYSAHDTTVYAFAKAQDSDAFYVPPFGCAIIMEKYTDADKSEYLRMLAWDPVSSETFRPVRIGDCAEFCPLDNYLEIVKINLPTEEDLEFVNSLP